MTKNDGCCSDSGVFATLAVKIIISLIHKTNNSFTAQLLFSIELFSIKERKYIAFASLFFLNCVKNCE